MCNGWLVYEECSRQSTSEKCDVIPSYAWPKCLQWEEALTDTGEDTEKGKLLCWQEHKWTLPLWRTLLKIPKKIEKDLPVSTTSLMVIYPKETKLVFQRDTCYTGLPEKRNQPRFPPGMAEYYAVVKKGNNPINSSSGWNWLPYRWRKWVMDRKASTTWFHSHTETKTI